MSNNDTIEDFGAALAENVPATLLLGQSFLADYQGRSPLSALLEQRFSTADLYKWWFNTDLALRDRVEAVRAISRIVVPPTDRAPLTRFPWRSVITSAIDSTARTMFEVPNVRLVAQNTHTLGPEQDSGSLPLFRLFGTVDRDRSDEHPPETAQKLRSARTEASARLSRLAELVTPSGILVIAGWNGKTDWLRPRELASALAPLAPGQVFLFGHTAESAADLDEDLADLVNDGVIQAVPDRASEVLHQLIRRACVQHQPATDAEYYLDRPLRNDEASDSRPADPAIHAILSLLPFGPARA